MKAVAIALLILVIGLGWRLNAEVENSAKLRGNLENVHAQLADKSKTESLQLQEKCGAQAEKVFHSLGYKDQQQNLNVDVYQSHYNREMGKCFVAIESTDMTTAPGKQAVSRYLFDAFEQREYAEYHWLSSDNKKYWEVKPFICELIESSNSVQVCKSDEEYKAFVAKYIE